MCNGGRVSAVEEGRVLEMEGGVDCTTVSVCVMLLDGALRSGSVGKLCSMYILPQFRKWY